VHTRIFSAPIFFAFALIALVQASASSQTPGSTEDHFRRGIAWQVTEDWDRAVADSLKC
jgi:hypothetical protein